VNTFRSPSAPSEVGHSLLRKVNPARLLARRANGIFIADNRKARIGSDLFRAACGMGLEGIVSSASGFPGRPVALLDITKNPASPTMTRGKNIDWSERL
jgi:bifunctional non-homologous end joining protein LigD